MLSCHQLECYRGEKRLFSGLGFSLKPGMLMALTGANGSGKTTLLRIVAGLLKPEAGEILWDGEPIASQYDYHRELLYLGHQPALKPELTVYDNLHFWATLRDAEMLVPTALHYFDLIPYADVPVAELSAGWQRRVALARLVVEPARIWLLDEPATNLDREGMLLVQALIDTRIQQGGIVIMTTHADLAQLGLAALEISDFQGAVDEDGEGGLAC